MLFVSTFGLTLRLDDTFLIFELGGKSVVRYELKTTSRRSSRRYVHSDESNLASWAEACGRAKTISRIDLRLACGTHKRGKIKGLSVVLKLAFHAERTYSLCFVSLPLSFSLFLSSIRKFALHVFARNEISSKAFILIWYRKVRLSVQVELASLMRDVCDLITIPIRNENLQFRMQSIRKFRLNMVIANSNCNLWPN